MSGRTLCHHNITCLLHNAHTIRVEQLAVTLAALAELELEVTLSIEDLNAMRVGVSDNYVIVGVDGDTARLGELAIVDAKLAELAVEDHLGAGQLHTVLHVILHLRIILHQIGRAAVGAVTVTIARGQAHV